MANPFDALKLASIFIVAGALGLGAQQTAGPPTLQRADTILAANSSFQAGHMRRVLLGDNWRDEWATPIAAPYLDLRTFAGGLTPSKTGGGFQTTTLHLEGKNGTSYIFRPVNKGVPLPDVYRHTLVWTVVGDARSTLYPVAPLLSDPILTAAGILHPSPTLVVMPDDPLLGEFRQKFAGVLGTIEERPDTPEKGRAFAGAAKIVDSDVLLKAINHDPEDTVDARAYLRARLVDMLLNDNDRHPGQWAWAKLGTAAGAPWLPIPRDRDKVVHSEEGLIPKLAGIAGGTPITAFDSAYPAVNSLITQALDMDRRLLIGLDRSVWDAEAISLRNRITNAVIDAAVARLPREYSASFPEISAKLRARRDALPGLARRFYSVIADVPDIHGTDADEWATVSRSGDGIVDVTLQAVDRPPYFQRRFTAGESKELRIYLHGGNDIAVVRGDVRNSIPVRIIGGNGTNRFIDSSRVAGKRNPTHFYDAGTVTGVRYDADSSDKRVFGEEVTPFNRRPWSTAYGELAPAQKDRGTSMAPVGSIGSGHGLGVVASVGLARYTYGFRDVPYATMTSAEVAYSTAIKGFDVDLGYDKRFESSSFHVPVLARMSQLDVVQFGGFGNSVPEPSGAFFDVRQRGWSFRPAIGFSPNARSDISLGPVVRYTSTDSTANRLISQLHPYGFDNFGQAGLQLAMHYDTRGSKDLFRLSGRNVLVDLAAGDSLPAVWGKMDFTASAYPGMMDVKTPYEKIGGVASAYITAPVLTRPVLALRGGGEKLYGDFPFFDAAFIGGSHSFRTEYRQRYAGDASLFGTTELRVPLATFPLILPLNVGAIGFLDVARVYVDGDSPGGWHQASGAGLWVSFVRPDLGFTIMRTSSKRHPTYFGLGFTF